jgi:uncharacterized membrane protein
MSERSFWIVQLPVTLGTGLIAGTFFCFSSFVMPALARLEPIQGITAMQKINITVVNPLFMGVLFGTAFLYVVQAFLAWRSGFDTQSVCWLIAAILYIAGTIGTTIIFNVPLNNELANLTPTIGDMAFWSRYLEVWTMWNSLRGAAASAACVTSIYAFSL